MKKFILLMVILLNGLCVFANDYNVYKFDNGHTLIVKQISSNPIVIIDTWIKTGSINENDKNTGVSHFLEHLFFKGTEKNPAGTFDRILESKGAVTNAATSKDFTHYYIKIPSKDFDLALNLHADMLLNPQIPRNEMEKERKVVLEEIAKDKNSPSDIAYNNLNELIFKVHPYKRQVIGTSKVIETITREEILDYYKKHYAPENMITVIVGDVNPDETAQKVRKAFTIEQRKLEKNKYQKEPKITEKRTKEVTADSNSAYMMIGFRGTNAVHRDEFALDILSTILGEGQTSRFYQNVKDKKQLANAVVASNLSLKDDGIFLIRANFKPENKSKLENEIFNEIKKIQKDGVTAEEVNIAKNIIERDTYYSRESVSNVASEMGYTVVLTNNPKNYDDYLRGISAVTAKDVQKVAKKYLNENQSAVSIVLPEKYNNKVEKSDNKDVSHNAKLVKSAYNTEKYQLDTGATLLINKHQNNDIVAFAIRAKGGEFIENKTGVASLMSSTISKGTKKYSKLELSQILEENGINISTSADSDYFAVNVLTTKKQLPLTFELLNEIVNNATFDEFELEKTRKNILEAIKTKRDIPLNRALEEYRTYIYEGSVYSNTSKILEKALPKVQRNDVVNYYNKIFYPENLVISVNGDVDKQLMIDKFSEIFNNKSNGKKFSYIDYANSIKFRLAPKVIRTEIKDLQTSWIILGWQTAGNAYLKDFATLQIIDSFMGTGMSSRLFRHLREEQGLAYQIGTGYSPNVLKGAFTLYIGTNPKNVKIAREQMMQQMLFLKNEFVSEKELQNAKDELIGKFILALETNLDKASGLALYEATGRGFDFVEKYPALIQSITPSDIMEVANKYFLDNYVESIVDKAK